VRRRKQWDRSEQ